MASNNAVKATYKDAGVDIDLATQLLSSVKQKLASARRPEMLAPIGGFGGLFQLDLSKYKNPVLVSRTPYIPSVSPLPSKTVLSPRAQNYRCA